MRSLNSRAKVEGTGGSTCMMVLAASTGIRKILKAPAEAEAKRVFAKTGRVLVDS